MKTKELLLARMEEIRKIKATLDEELDSLVISLNELSGISRDTAEKMLKSLCENATDCYYDEPSSAIEWYVEEQYRFYTYEQILNTFEDLSEWDNKEANELIENAKAEMGVREMLIKEG